MKTYYIKNVDCENCARKIENQIKKKTNAESVTINLISNKLLISDEQVTAEALTKIANQVETGIIIDQFQTGSDHEAPEATKQKLVVLAIGFGFFGLGLVTQYQVLYLIGYLVVGYPVIKLALKNIVQRQFFDEYFLMTIATVAAISINQWSEALAVMLFYSVGEYIQARTLDKTKLSITKLAELNVRAANLVTGSKTMLVPVEQLQVGDQIKVASGERIAVDAKLISTIGYIDTSHISGESEPQTILTGAQTYGGSVNSGDEILLEVTATADNSMIAKLIELVTYADSKKTKTEQFMTRFSKIYTPIVVGLAVAIVVLFPPILGITYDDAIYRAVTLLVISCPCAFVLSVPLGYVVAIGRLAKEHVLVKGSLAIDRLNKVSMLAVDKTGTLTTGEFAVTKFINKSNYQDSYIHGLINSAEANVSHPIARSLVKYTAQYDGYQVLQIKQNSGLGISFIYNGNNYRIEKANSSRAVTVSNVIENDQVIASYIMEDQVKPEAVGLASRLKQLNVELVMLTGDNEQVANKVANAIGISKQQVYSSLLPAEKLAIVETQINKGHVVGFVGDGLNDAAVIKRSDLGVAMGARGSELSIDSSDVVISDDQVNKIVDAIYISKYSNKIIKQNIGLAFVVKIVFIVLGVFGITTMWEAVFSDVGVTLIAIANSMRIKRK